MKPFLSVPVAPPLSPLAEVVLAFEEAEPEACALLQPFTEDIGRDELEVRARRKFPQHSSEQRFIMIEKAWELLELGRQGMPGPRRIESQRSDRATTSPVERERLRGVLENAFTTDPALTAGQARALLGSESAIQIPTGTFYGSYWKPVIGRLPSTVIERRRHLTERRPGTGTLDLTDKQRDVVRATVAEIKRDHPDFDYAQIMDEIRRTTRFQFCDPVSFNRYYVQSVNPAPARSRKAVKGKTQGGIKPGAAPANIRSRITEAAPARAQAPEPRVSAALAGILTNLDPFSPAQLARDESGRVKFQMNFDPMNLASGYRMLGLLYSELADMAESESA